MLTCDFDYLLPPELIAQTPVEPRDSSRLMVVNKEKQTIEHRRFFDIIDYLQPGDLLVWNNSKVFKARLFGKIKADDVGSEKIVEIFLVRPTENKHIWKALAKPGRKLKTGSEVVFAEDFGCEVVNKEADGTILVRFTQDDALVRVKANVYGQVPLPPYVENKDVNEKSSEVNARYQTIYAKHEGSVAAPTAGFHFTPELIEKIKNKGVQCAEVTLHVGLGTFLPVKTEVVEEHAMHSEWVEITEQNARLINEAKAAKRRVVAVGTTTVRTLEGLAQFQLNSRLAHGRVGEFVLQPFSGDINIFITPGFTFRVVDALVTNFHLPKSTLLMLVSAFAESNAKTRHGREFMLKCYVAAVKEKYRFFSFGDAMFIV